MKIKKIITYTFAIFLSFVVLVNLIVYASSRPYIYDNIEGVKEAQIVLILGAAIYPNGELSPVFKNRVDSALVVYKASKAPKILVSGDNSTLYYNEVNPVKNYLIEKGVREEDIFLDHAGFDTYSSMYRARDIFEVSSVIVVTQAFHLPRAVFIARNLGLDAYGWRAPDSSKTFKNYMREILANEKAVMNLILHRQPKFLGDVIPIENVL